MPERNDDTASSASRVFFQQGCPVCGRRLEIDVNLLGRRVYCQHCCGGFVAMDPALVDRSAGVEATPKRVEALLEEVASRLDRAAAQISAGSSAD